MNFTITKQYLTDVIEEDLMSRFLNIVSINAVIQKNIIPWVATLTVVTNIPVCLMCCGIYLKTKRRNHKPAFVFIFFLNFVDVLLGM